MATNNFKPFATGAGANVTSQADYEALSALISGFQAGKASSAQINKALRQCSTMSAMLGQFIAAAGLDALDNGNLSTLLTSFTSALTANLSLGTASKKNVGTGAGQIPDMNSFPSGTGTNSFWYKYPNGKIEQFGYIVTSATSPVNVTFPTAFLNGVAGGGVAYSISPTSASNIIATATGSTLTTISGLRTFNTSGTQQANGVFWMAVGN